MDFRNIKTDPANPLVTIGILSYNYNRFIGETLNSVLGQTYAGIELVIVDDGSTDRSCDTIREWVARNTLECTFVIHDTNRGIAAACNTVISNAHGKYLVLFASDDIMNPERIANQVAVLEHSDERCAFCYSDAELINESGESMGLYSLQYNIHQFEEGNLLEAFILGEACVPAPTIMYRKQIFEQIGVYDERLATEDYGMHMRVIPYFTVRFCNYIGVKYRIKEQAFTTPEKYGRHQGIYHRDRIIIYFELYRKIKGETKWGKVNGALVRKINFHLINLCALNSPYIWPSTRYLIKNGFLNIAFGRIMKSFLSRFIRR